MKRILIIGGDSTLGNLINYNLKKKYEILKTSRKIKKNYLNLDLTWPQKKWPKIKKKIDAIIFCAGITEIFACETNKIYSKNVNIEGLKKTIKLYHKDNNQIIFLSSTAVFKGEKKKYETYYKTSPKNEYGRQKLQSEKIIKKNKGLIIRSAKIVDTLSKLLMVWKNNLIKKKTIFPFNNTYVSLVESKNIVEIIEKCILENVRGTLHISSDDEISYKKIAKVLAKKINKNSKLIKPINKPNQYRELAQSHSLLKTSYYVKKNTHLKKALNILNNFVTRSIM